MADVPFYTIHFFGEQYDLSNVTIKVLRPLSVAKRLWVQDFQACATIVSTSTGLADGVGFHTV